MKARHLIFIIALIVIADQVLKIYIKTNYPLNTTHHVVGSWFQLYFVENPGMAYGWKFGGNWGKLALTVFRLGAVVFGTWYLGKIIRQHYHKGFIICAALVYAGARNIMVSYWSVADESTSELMTDFYKELLRQPVPNFREALQQSKLKMIRNKKYSALYYWAPFVLIGF